MTGGWPRFTIDHINGDGSDNRWANLRDVPLFVNQQNMRKPRGGQRTNKIGVLGVTQVGRRFSARLSVDKRTTYLGTFDTPEEAHAAYLAAKRAHHAGCTV